ncbi:hypothetical protein PO902_05455 [Planococcus maritimus]|nr:hypothetical protein [Planococcus sp. SK3692]MDE4084492.1 hypothetical protein [Planococcus maritimus]
MDFKSKIMEVVTAAEMEINQLISSYEATINTQKEEIVELQKYKKQQEEMEKQKNLIQELREKLKLSEKEKALLQSDLYLEKAKHMKDSKVLPVQTIKTEEKVSTKTSSNTNMNPSKDEEWEKTLAEVQNDLKAAAEKKKREKSYYENSKASNSSIMEDLAALNNSLKPSIYRHKVNVVNQKTLEQLIPKYNLVEREAILPLYESKHSREIYLYTEVETILIDLLNKEIYMVESEFNKLLKRYLPLVIRYRQFVNTEIKGPEKNNIGKTEIQRKLNEGKKPSSYVPKDTLFSEQSELNEIGYRISDCTRDERWKVLNQAVLELGLKKVVSIISANIRIRKKQSYGERKYLHAIREWEHDLNRLKENYYYGEFKWPEV